MTRTYPCRMYRTGLTPPTPFLSNAVKYSPGRGWGWPREGDLGPATVLSHFLLLVLSFFPLKCCPFFFILCFCVWSGVFCRFFCRSSRLKGRFLEKFSGANFCFRVSVLVVCFLVLFCLCFCFIIWFFVPENVSRKFSSGQVRCLKKFSGANFCF